ncbi:MAG: dihydroorotate dehydrogenase electron transfer subunit [Oscillospiraceae bacterium]
MIQSLNKIVSKKQITQNCYDFLVFAPEMANQAKPGQFAHIMVEGFTLRRPISICEVKNSCLRFVFEVRGKGTDALSKINDEIDIIAPLGSGFTLLPKHKKAILIGGGIGTPPMLELAKYYGNNSKAIIGFRNKDIVILEDDFKSYTNNVCVCTDDGSKGRKGFVTDELIDSINNEKPDIIYACGPKVMLKAICDIAHKNNIECEISLEERMGCGVGACLVCACKLSDDRGYAHVCKTGPVFNSKDVDLD